MNATSGPRVQILHVADCPHVGRLRETTVRGLARAGCHVPIEEIEGDYPSPTLLVDGVDVLTGRPLVPHAACRLDIPTEDQVVAALRAAHLRRVRTTGGPPDPATPVPAPGPAPDREAAAVADDGDRAADAVAARDR